MALRMIRRRRRERNAIIPRPRVYRDRRNPLETMTDNELFKRYRFRRPTIEFIANGICHLLTSPTRRNKPILPIVQILLFLRFVATGSHLALIGDHLGVSESATGRACRKVCRAIWRFSPMLYASPTEKELSEYKRDSGESMVRFLIQFL